MLLTERQWGLAPGSLHRYSNFMPEQSDAKPKLFSEPETQGGLSLNAANPDLPSPPKVEAPHAVGAAEPGFKPKFLDPEAAASSEYIGEYDDPPDWAAIDHEEAMPDPNAALHARHKAAARLRAMGKNYTEIAKTLGYSRVHMSILFSSPTMNAEVARYRNRLYEQDLVIRMKELGPDAMDTFEKFIRSDKEKLKDRVDAAKWLLEKLTGKAKQEVNVESNTLAAFMGVLKQMQEQGETLETIDVTPQPLDPAGGNTENKALTVLPSASKFTKWVDDNLG